MEDAIQDNSSAANQGWTPGQLLAIILCSILFCGLVSALSIVLYHKNNRVITDGVVQHNGEAICDYIQMEERNTTEKETKGMRGDKEQEISVDVQITQ